MLSTYAVVLVVFVFLVVVNTVLSTYAVVLDVCVVLEVFVDCVVV